jgi:hypothetical protein
MRMILFGRNVLKLISNNVVNIILTLLPFLTATGLLSNVIVECDQSNINQQTGILMG